MWPRLALNSQCSWGWSWTSDPYTLEAGVVDVRHHAWCAPCELRTESQASPLPTELQPRLLFYVVMRFHCQLRLARVSQSSQVPGFRSVCTPGFKSGARGRMLSQQPDFGPDSAFCSIRVFCWASETPPILETVSRLYSVYPGMPSATHPGCMTIDGHSPAQPIDTQN